jgi:rubrerythrin
MHATCARLSPCYIDYDEKYMLCPYHTQNPPKDDIVEIVISEYRKADFLPVENLEAFARRFPTEHRTFSMLSRSEQLHAMTDPQYESELLKDLEGLHAGSRCDVCYKSYGDLNIHLEQCSSCKACVCFSCLLPPELRGNGKKKDFLCPLCRDLKAKQKDISDFPGCSACCQKGGWARKARGGPGNKLKEKEFWCHALCSRYVPAAHESLGFEG